MKRPPRPWEGRPLKYTQEELELAFNDYKVLMIQEKRPFTKSWFNVYLWVDKNYLSELPSQYSGTYRRITHEIENHLEEWLLTNKYSSTWTIFNLKNNYWWSDKQEIEHSWDFKINLINYGDNNTTQLSSPSLPAWTTESNW